jgi:hypothetical protein
MVSGISKARGSGQVSSEVPNLVEDDCPWMRKPLLLRAEGEVEDEEMLRNWWEAGT